MKTYIALLRGINVSGKNKVPMAELRSILKGLELENLQTYIQTGNLVFNSTLEKSELTEILQNAILEHFGFQVPTLVLTPAEMQEIFDNAPFPNSKIERRYYVFLFEAPPQELIDEIQTLKFEGESFLITNSCVYLYVENGYGNAKLNNNYFEKKLGVKATTRNYKTLVKLLSLCQ